MKRVLVVATTAAVVAGVTGCAAGRSRVVAPTSAVGIAADLPPSPATWPKYPHFSQRSCSGQPFPSGTSPTTERLAPSYAPRPQRHPLGPAEIVRRFLARFGDRRYIHSITFPVYLNGRPPGAQLAADIHDPVANERSGVANPTPDQDVTQEIAWWEAALAFGALRDDFCAAGGPSLAGASLAGASDGGNIGNAQDLFALDQRFPNPSPAAFRRRVALVGKRFGFHVVSLRLLRPEQIAPILIVKTSRDRESFARDVPTILELLNPTSRSGGQIAETFEGFFFAAEDSRGLFVFTDSVFRGQEEGGQWAASENLYPFSHG